MWEIRSSFADCDIATKYQRLGPPKKVFLDVFLGDSLWKQGELVQPVTIPLDLLGSKVYLGDVGLTIKDGTSMCIKHQAPYCFCAPERFHGAEPSLASDMWSFMCILTVLYLGYNVFNSGVGRSVAFSWIEQLGAMPKQWKGRYLWPREVDDAWYDHTTTPGPERDFASKIARLRPDTSQAERELVLSIMHKVFCYLPERRITAGQLLEDPSFRSLMKIYQC